MPLKELKSRWKSKTPSFWKKAQRIGIAAGVIGASILAIPVSLPAALITSATYLITIGTTTATLSQLTKD